MDLKAKARKYYTAVNQYDHETVIQMVDEGYIQHNLRVPTGRDAFVNFLPILKDNGTKIHNYRMLQDGHDIIMHHLWTDASPFGANELVAFHIIRFNNNGLIAEHWSVMAPVTSPNPSGRLQLDGPVEICDHEKTATHKMITRKLFQRLLSANLQTMPELLSTYYHKNFRQHHPLIGDGINGLSTAIEKHKIDISYLQLHGVFAEGNFTLAICEGYFNGIHTAFYDLLRFESDKIAEHWSVYQDIPTENLANTNSMFGF